MLKHHSERIQNVIQLELFKAQESIKIAVAWFTNELLFQPLLLKLQTGVSVELILNHDEINVSENNPIDFSEFVRLGGKLHWNKTKTLLHDKFCIIDERVVIDGSYNWTNKAEYNNETITVTDVQETIDFYLKKFEHYCRRYGVERIATGSHRISTGTIRRPAIRRNNFSQNIVENNITPHIPEIRELNIPEGTLTIVRDMVKNSEIKPDFIPESVTAIGAQAFYNCAKLITLEIPDTVKTIGEQAFFGCHNLTSVKLPNSLELIDNGVFNQCAKLFVVKVPDSVKSIGKEAFWRCKSLQNVDLSGSVEIIGAEAFAYCTSLQKVSTSKALSRIEGSAFSDCTTLQDIKLPKLLTYIGGGAFQNCKSLQGEFAFDNLKYLGDRAFYGCRALQGIKLPNTLKSIGNETFRGCASLRYCNIPESAAKIFQFTFDGCALLEHIIVPKAILEIGQNAFRDCESLKSVEFKGFVEKITKTAFKGCKSLQQIIVPVNAREHYEKLLPANLHGLIVEEKMIVDRQL